MKAALRNQVRKITPGFRHTAVLLLFWVDQIGLGLPRAAHDAGDTKKLCPAQGGVDPGEDLITAALREGHEELGIPTGDFKGVLAGLGYEEVPKPDTRNGNLGKAYDLVGARLFQDTKPQITLSPTEFVDFNWYEFHQGVSLVEARNPGPKGKLLARGFKEYRERTF